MVQITSMTSSHKVGQLAAGLRPRYGADRLAPVKPPRNLSETSDRDAFEMELLRIWVQSQMGPDDGGRAAGTVWKPRSHHELTRANTLSIIHLLRMPLFTIPLLRRLTKDLKVRLVALLIGHLVSEFIPLFITYLYARLVDLLHRVSTSGSTTTVFECIGVAIMDVSLRSLQTLIECMHEKNRAIIKLRVSRNFDCDLIAAMTSLSLRARASPSIGALVASAEMRNPGYFSSLEYALLRLPSAIMVLMAQLCLLFRFIRTEGAYSWNWAYGVISCFAPIIWDKVTDKIDDKTRAMEGRHQGYQREDWQQMLQADAKEMIVFGSQPLVMRAAEAQFKARLHDASRGKGPFIAMQVVQSLTRRMTDKGLEILLAGGRLFDLTPGAITLCQQTIRNIELSVDRIKARLSDVYSAVFNFAAYTLAIRLSDNPHWIGVLLEVDDDPDSHTATLAGFCTPTSTGTTGVRGPGASNIDYDTVRSEGMCIEAKNLSFQYPGQPEPTLKGINLRIEPGETVALVGYNGGGKTTLLQVLVGLWGKPDGGELLVNGMPIERFNPATLHNRTSVLFQDFQRYYKSLEHNVALHMVDHLEDEVPLLDALKQGGAEGIVAKATLGGHLTNSASRTTTFSPRPKKHPQTKARVKKGKKVGISSVASQASSQAASRAQTSNAGLSRSESRSDVEGKSKTPASSPFQRCKTLIRRFGIAIALLTDAEYEPEPEKEPTKWTGLSGGQWQRVALSRAFFFSEGADLVAFDEPSAALDPQAEVDLFHRVHALSTSGNRKRTTIYISHRFSTVRKADKIAVVENGTVTEFGSHADLMQKKGRYHELLSLQKGEWED